MVDHEVDIAIAKASHGGLVGRIAFSKAAGGIRDSYFSLAARYFRRRQSSVQFESGFNGFKYGFNRALIRF